MNIADRITASRTLREKLLADPYRPAYHFTDPEDVGIPGDSNGCFYADGLYHLMYLNQCRDDSFRWGHVTSTDLLHWRHRPDALIPDEGPADGGNAAVWKLVKNESCPVLRCDTPLALAVKGCLFTFASPVGELMRGGGRLNVRASDLEVKGVDGPFLRRWGECRETFDCDAVKGLDGESASGEGEFAVRKI